MRKAFLLAASSVVIISSILTVVLLRPYHTIPDPSRFRSFIGRHVPDESFLPILLSLENISGNSSYFDGIKGEHYEDHIENISILIEREQKFLNSYYPEDYTNEGYWPFHEFSYSANLTHGIPKSEFLSMIHPYPSFMFYFNYSNEIYSSITVFNDSSPDQEYWMIEDIIDHLFTIRTLLIFVNQTMIISDVYAPLAGYGTQFTRFILCLPDGQPVFFISDEGGWWVS
ncbi:MAG: hypothetical protein HGN29_15160 [Asgard group archaeon]|nr:hypothetical protein [Asgard group archaeon]